MVFPSKQRAANHSAAAQKAAALLKKQKKEIVVGAKTKAAIEAMVYEGKLRSEAAEAAAMSDESLRQALLKPHNLAYLNECMEVLRTSGRPRALRKVIELIDKGKQERIQFEAAKYIDGMDRPSHAVGATVNVQNNINVSLETPGYVIKLDRKHGQQIEHLKAHEAKSLSHNADVPEDE